MSICLKYGQWWCLDVEGLWNVSSMNPSNSEAPALSASEYVALQRSTLKGCKREADCRSYGTMGQLMNTVSLNQELNYGYGDDIIFMKMCFSTPCTQS